MCHGSAGLIETLMQGSESLGDDHLGELGREAADALMIHGSWLGPSAGDFVRANPTLMLGVAGVGHQLLRILCPQHRSYRAGRTVTPIHKGLGV